MKAVMDKATIKLGRVFQLIYLLLVPPQEVAAEGGERFACACMDGVSWKWRIFLSKICGGVKNALGAKHAHRLNMQNCTRLSQT